MANPATGIGRKPSAGKNTSTYLIILAVASAIYLGCIVSPPSLMDDVDAVQAQIARNMLATGDWVTPRLDGVVYLEKPPLIYWMIAASYKIFGVHDWAARIPIAVSSIALCWVVTAFAIWAFGRRAGLYSGLCTATCVGLFLFTRILIPDVMLTLTTALAMWAFLRAVNEDEQETHPRFWAFVFAVCLGIGLLLKSLIAIVFPLAAGSIYLLLGGQFSLRVWKRLRPLSGCVVILLVAAPWHLLATLRNPPYFSFSLHSGPGQYHGFLWFFFINEQFLRFLNLRYPRDYNTVPRLYFWLLHLLWLFPWSVYLPALAKLSYKPLDRAGRVRLLAVCWIGFILIFFTFSTTQEYYSMPGYPALCLLLGSAMAEGGAWIRRGTYVLTAVAGTAAAAAATVLFLVRNIPAPGDISMALTQRLQTYTLALSHLQDLNVRAFAYLRTPLTLAAVCFLIGLIGMFRAPAPRAFVVSAVMMILFFQAARLAMVKFDPYMSSRPLAEALMHAPQGNLIIDHHYYTFSSVFFYTNRNALLLNGRFNNLEYGAYAPKAPAVFIDDPQMETLWVEPGRCYLLAKESSLPRLQAVLGDQTLNVVAESGGKLVVTNHPLPPSSNGFRTLASGNSSAVKER